MLPRWTLDETFDKLAEYGYEAVELRCRFNPDDSSAEPAFWGRHLSDVRPDNIVEKAPAIRAAAERSGVRVAALAPKCLIDEEDEIRKLFVGAVAIDKENPPLIPSARRATTARRRICRNFWPRAAVLHRWPNWQENMG